MNATWNTLFWPPEIQTFLACQICTYLFGQVLIVISLVVNQPVFVFDLLVKPLDLLIPLPYRLGRIYTQQTKQVKKRDD